jgi:hypothetical protein
MIIKEYGNRCLKYISRYPKHYAGYVAFGVGFGVLSLYFRQSKQEILRIGFAGAIAQFATEIILHPIDVINTRTKAEIAHADNINSYKMIQRIMDKEGLFGFWRGASATYYGALLGGLIYFSAYKYLKKHLSKLHENKEGLNYLTYLASSLLGETLFLLFYYPYDLIRTRMQTRVKGFEYKGPLDGLRKILSGKQKTGKLRKLYTGATPSFILNLSNQSIMFTVLESMREFFLKRNNLHSVSQLSMGIYLLCSVSAGVVSGAATNIMEVITIHKQVDPTFKFAAFIKAQGVKALTQGLFARVTINVFHTVILFFVVDYMSALFNVEL